MNFLMDWLQSLLWRRKFQAELRQLENIPAPAIADDELWARIVKDIEHAEAIAIPKRRLRPHGLVLAAGAIVLCFASVKVFESAALMPGIKSAPAEFEVLPTSILAFAILKDNGDIIRGSKEARLLAEDAVIFYVETPGLIQGATFTLDIQVQTPTGQLEKIVDHYRIQSSTETIKGQLGFIVYKPDTPGIYNFYGTRYLEKSSEKFAGFSIERIN